jgi:hypothetical protein
MGHEAVVDRQADIAGKTHDLCEVEANAFAAEFLVPEKALLAWGRACGPRHRVTLEDVVRLACEYGVSTIMMRYRLATCGLLDDERRAREIDREIANELHVKAMALLGLSLPDDELAQAKSALPRIPTSLRDTQLGDLLTGRTDVASAAARVGLTEQQLCATIEATMLDRLLPAYSP